MRSFEGKVCLVTGGGSGIGQAVALGFAREGGRVIVADVNAEVGKETLNHIKELGKEAIFVQVDVSKVDEVEAMVSNIIQTYGRLDCAVNNAGVGGKARNPINNYSEEDWHRILSVNLTGVWNCLKYELTEMLKQGGGAIVNMSSVAGLKGFAGQCAYTASKHGVIGLTKTAALENAANNIRVNAVCPSFIETPLLMKGWINAGSNPKIYEALSNLPAMKRMGTAEEVAEAVLWLCSEAASYVTGSALAVDGGLMII